MAMAKLAQLRKKSSKDGFEVINGVDFQVDGRKDFGFVSIELVKKYFMPTHHEDVHACLFWEKSNELRDISVREYALNEQEENATEEFLLVIIPQAYRIETSCEKVAGRKPSEGIWKMQEGDIIVVSYNNESKPETYKVIRDDKELFLVKKRR